MKLKKNPASNWKLYCIIDKSILGRRSPRKMAKILFEAGVDVVQLRYKNYPSYKLTRIAKSIQPLARKYHKTLLLNDRVDAAVAGGARGVHLGSGDFSPGTVYRLLKSKSIIGRTIHKPCETKRLTDSKINYISVGPIFPTPLKKELKKQGIRFIKKIKSRTSLPVFAIGGINKRNVKDVLRGGANGVCVTRAVSQAKEILREIEK